MSVDFICISLLLCLHYKLPLLVRQPDFNSSIRIKLMQANCKSQFVQRPLPNTLTGRRTNTDTHTHIHNLLCNLDPDLRVVWALQLEERYVMFCHSGFDVRRSTSRRGNHSIRSQCNCIKVYKYMYVCVCICISSSAERCGATFPAQP